MSNDTVLLQQIYPDTPGVALLDLNIPRNTAYCEMHEMDYVHEVANMLKGSDPLLGSWSKVWMILRALDAGYKRIIWLDADTIIRDMDADLREPIKPDSIGVCWHRIPQLNHWNVGAEYIGAGPQVTAFIRTWLEAYPGADDGWMEQGVFNRLAMQGKVVHTISDRWNATLNHTMVPDAVVLGFHGYEDTSGRLEAMKATINSLEKAELPVSEVLA